MFTVLGSFLFETCFWIFFRAVGPFSEPCPFGLTHLEFSGLHCCLFVKVRFLSLDWKLFCLVQTQLWYNIMCFILCQDFFQTFWISFPPLLFFAVDFYYNTKSKNLSTHKFKFMCSSQFLLNCLHHRGEKFGSTKFPALPLAILAAKRRKRDLNPRAAWTTYTLSRGASSASWVFLHNLNCFPLPIFCYEFFTTQKLLYISKYRLSTVTSNIL